MKLNGFAGWREDRRLEREAARERAQRQQEQIDELLAEYPIDRSQRAATHTGSHRGLAATPYGGDGGFWSGFSSDCGDGGFWSGFGGGFGGDGGGGC